MREALSSLPVGCEAVVQGLRGDGPRRRLLALGFVPGTRVKVLRASPLGDPRAYLVRGTIIALRREDAALVIVSRGR